MGNGHGRTGSGPTRGTQPVRLPALERLGSQRHDVLAFGVALGL